MLIISQQKYSLVPSVSHKMKVSCSALFHTKTRACPKYPVRDCRPQNPQPSSIYQMGETNARKPFCERSKLVPVG